MHNNDVFNLRESKVDKIVKKFGKFKTLISSVLKLERDKKVTVVCAPQAFPGSMFMEWGVKPNEGRR